MTETDIQQGKQLLQEDFIKANPKCEALSARCEMLRGRLTCAYSRRQVGEGAGADARDA